MNKQNVFRKMTGVFFAALLLAVGVFALPGLTAQIASAAAAPGLANRVSDKDGDLNGESEDGDDDDENGESEDGDYDDAFSLGFGRRGGNLFRILFILIPVFLVMGLAGLGWFFARRRKAAVAMTANASPPQTPDDPNPSVEA